MFDFEQGAPPSVNSSSEIETVWFAGFELNERQIKAKAQEPAKRGDSFMTQLKYWYEIHNYQSHRRVAEVYRQMLSRRYIPAVSIDAADVVVLHLEPHDYESIFNRFPALRNKYVISYCVWEASELPAAYQRSLALVQEVWTCSEYCLGVIKKHHPRVFRVPHTIVREQLNHDIEDEIIRRLICYDRNNYYFLSIGRTLGSRKNLSGLVQVFETTASSMPNARLVIKGLPKDAAVPEPDTFAGKDNSFLVHFAENYIREDEIFGLFTPQMKWADPDPEHLRNIMLSLYDGSLRKEAIQKSERALEDIQHFSTDSVRELLLGRMEEVRLRAA